MPLDAKRGSESPELGAVYSRPTRGSSPRRRFLSLMLAAAACAKCARGGGSGNQGRGSWMLRCNQPDPLVIISDSGPFASPASPHWGPKRLPYTL